MSVVRTYSEVHDSDRSLVGGKGWSIARLARANLRVPEGFCVTRDLIASILSHDTGLQKAYAAYLERVDSTGLSDPRMSHHISEAMLQVPLEATALSELRAALGTHIPASCDRIIVRSSASIEDSKKTSFAGQFCSTVTRNDAKDLLRGIRECWQAVLSPSLAAYAFAMRVNLAGLSFGFVVQMTGLSDPRMSHHISEAMLQVPLEATALSELRAALGTHIPASCDRIIVRSSASIEDSKKTSFAGQFCSTVTRNDAKDLLRGIRECWQAVLSPSLAAYAFAMRVNLAGLSFGFVVQEFLDCDYGGVLFTRSPGGRDRDDYLVEYAVGGAQNIVSGRGIPGHCLLKGGKQSVQWLRRVPEARHPSEDILLQLGRLAERCRELFKSEQDIEWGVMGARVFLLQSRPLTV